MIIAPYNKDLKYDSILHNIISGVTNRLHQKDDDFLLFCLGTTGTGKSMLMLHVMEQVLGPNANIDLVGLDRKKFPLSVQMASKSPHPRFCVNDEANISKRDSLSSYNKDVIDLYFSIRGKQIFHWWNNPSLDMLDKAFIEERIKGFIYIFTKTNDRPRLYYYFKKEDMLRLWDKYKILKLPLLNRVAGAYAHHRGWFKIYDGPLLKNYLSLKESRMDDKINDFVNRFADNGQLSSRDICKSLGIVAETKNKYEKILLERGIISPQELEVRVTGRKFYAQSVLSKMEELAKELSLERKKHELSR